MARKIVSFQYDDGTVVKVSNNMQVIVDDPDSGKVITQGAGDTVTLLSRSNVFMRLRKLQTSVDEVLR